MIAAAPQARQGEAMPGGKPVDDARNEGTQPNVFLLRGHEYENAKEIIRETIVDFGIGRTIISAICQGLLALAARPRTRLSSMFVDQSNM